MVRPTDMCLVSASTAGYPRAYILVLTTLCLVHRYVRVLDFSTFRTQGLRRTVGDGQVARFVTPARLLALITSVRDSLTTFGASENMDSALTLPVLESLLFRPTSSSEPGSRGERSRPRPTRTPYNPTAQPSPLSSSSVYDPDDPTSSLSRTSTRGKTFLRRAASLRGVSLESIAQRRSNALEIRATLQDANPPMQRKQLKALDLCGCVSVVFQEGLHALVEKHLVRPPSRTERTDRSGRFAERRGRSRTRDLTPQPGTEESGTESDHRIQTASQPAPLLARSSTVDGAGPTAEEASRGRNWGGAARVMSLSNRTRSHSSSRHGTRTHARNKSYPFARSEWKPAQFPYVQRLGLSGVRTQPASLERFVLAFPHLTHLDLSRTMITDTLLSALSSSTTLRLRSLGLAECVLLSSRGLTDLILSPLCWDLNELSLRRTTDGPALTRGDAEQVLRKSPCLVRGQMRYLDLGGCGVDDVLLTLLPPQPWLLDLGLSRSPYLSLPAVASWLLFNGRAVEVLDLSYSGDGTLHGPVTATKLYTMLLQPLAEPPQPSLTEQLAGLGNPPAPREATTNLQCVGLSPASLLTVGGGIGRWRAIRGAGRRGWIVDTAAVTIVNPEVERAWVHNLSSLLPPRPPCVSNTDVPFLPEQMREQNSDPIRYDDKGPHDDTMEVSDGREEAHAQHQTSADVVPQSRVLRDLPPEHPRVQAMRALADNQFNVASVGWHSHKSDILHGLGFLGRESGSYAHVAYART